MSSIVYLLLLCLSLHACNAGHLGVDIDDKQTREGFLLFGKGLVQDVEKEKHQETSIPSSVSPSFSEGLRTQEKLIHENDETEIHEGWVVSNNINHKETKAPPPPWKENEDTKVVGLAENGITASSSQEVLQEANKIEEWKKLARRKMLGSTTQDAEETVDSKEEKDAAVEEDIVVMDYAQPHRKPPIHNYRGP